MTHLHDMTAGELLANYKSRKLSPVEVVDAVIAGRTPGLFVPRGALRQHPHLGQLPAMGAPIGIRRDVLDRLVEFWKTPRPPRKSRPSSRRCPSFPSPGATSPCRKLSRPTWA